MDLLCRVETCCWRRWELDYSAPTLLPAFHRWCAERSMNFRRLHPQRILREHRQEYLARAGMPFPRWAALLSQ